MITPDNLNRESKIDRTNIIQLGCSLTSSQQALYILLDKLRDLELVEMNLIVDNLMTGTAVIQLGISGDLDANGEFTVPDTSAAGTTLVFGQDQLVNFISNTLSKGNMLYASMKTTATGTVSICLVHAPINEHPHDRTARTKG